MPGFYDFRLKFEYFKAIKESLAPTDQLHEVLNTIIKLFGCNSVDRFSLEQFKSMDAAPLLKEIVDFTHSSNFTLAQLEMFSELVSSEIFTPEMIQKLHRETIRSSSQLLQHIIEFETDKMI